MNMDQEKVADLLRHRRIAAAEQRRQSGWRTGPGRPSVRRASLPSWRGSADCSQFVCEIPYGGEQSNGLIREQIFRQKIAVIKKFQKAAASSQSPFDDDRIFKRQTDKGDN